MAYYSIYNLFIQSIGFVQPVATSDLKNEWRKKFEKKKMRVNKNIQKSEKCGKNTDTYGK